MDPGLGSNHNLTSTREQLGLTSEVGKALKLSTKSITDDKWKQHDVSGTRYITSLRMQMAYR